MIHMRLVNPKGDLRGFGLTMAQWQIVRNRPWLRIRFSKTSGTSPLPAAIFRGCERGLSDLQRVQFLWCSCPAGPWLQPSDAIDGQDPQPVVVLGYKFWQRHFNSDPGVLGKTIQMVRKNYTIVG